MKFIFVLCMVGLINCVLFAEQVLSFIAEKNTVAYRDGGGSELVLHAGDTITANAVIVYGATRGRGLDQFHLLIMIGEPGNIYWAFAKYFRPQNTENVFSDDIFIDYPMDRNDPSSFLPPLAFGNPPATIIDEMWLPSFYVDVLKGQNRSILLEIRPDLGATDDFGTPWYVNPLVNLQNGRAMFYNSAIRLGHGTHLAVKNIKRTDFGYQIDCVVSIRDFRWGGGFSLLEGSRFWESYIPGDAVTLLLHIDGDFLDIYTYGTDIHVGTFIRVGREFQIQYQSLIRTNTSDLTNVLWPRRADGRMDILPPDGLTLAFRATHTTTARLNVRDNPATTAPLVTTLELGTEVQMLETGSLAIIGEITAPWIRVLSAGGFTGWVFSGFLEAITVEGTVVAEYQPIFEAPAAFVPQADSVVEGGMSLWVSILIIIGAIILICITLIVVKKHNKINS